MSEQVRTRPEGTLRKQIHRLRRDPAKVLSTRWATGLVTIGGGLFVAAGGLVLEGMTRREWGSQLVWQGTLTVLGLVMLLSGWRALRSRGTLYFVRVLDSGMVDWHEHTRREMEKTSLDIRVASAWVPRRRRFDQRPEVATVVAELERASNDDSEDSLSEFAPNVRFPASLAVGFGWVPRQNSTLVELSDSAPKEDPKNGPTSLDRIELSESPRIALDPLIALTENYKRDGAMRVIPDLTHPVGYDLGDRGGLEVSTSTVEGEHGPQEPEAAVLVIKATGWSRATATAGTPMGRQARDGVSRVGGGGARVSGAEELAEGPRREYGWLGSGLDWLDGSSCVVRELTAVQTGHAQRSVDGSTPQLRWEDKELLLLAQATAHAILSMRAEFPTLPVVLSARLPKTSAMAAGWLLSQTNAVAVNGVTTGPLDVWSQLVTVTYDSAERISWPTWISGMQMDPAELLHTAGMDDQLQALRTRGWTLSDGGTE